jgi:hypothetical protein
MKKMANSLRTLHVNERARISSIAARGEMSRRLQDMGLVPGTEVKVIGRAPLASFGGGRDHYDGLGPSGHRNRQLITARLPGRCRDAHTHVGHKQGDHASQADQAVLHLPVFLVTLA